MMTKLFGYGGLALLAALALGTVTEVRAGAAVAVAAVAAAAVVAGEAAAAGPPAAAGSAPSVHRGITRTAP